MGTPGQKNFLYDAVLPKVERIGWLLAVLGFGLKYWLVTGAVMLLLVGLGTLAQVFFLRTFETASDRAGATAGLTYTPVSPAPLTGFMPFAASKVQCLAGAVTLVGILFKLLFWKGSGVMLSVGTSLLVSTIAIQWTVGYQSWRALLVAGLGGLMWATPTEIIVRQLYRDDPTLVERVLYQHQHPNDKAATAEVVRRLQARRKR